MKDFNMNGLSLSMVITNTQHLASGMSPKMLWPSVGGSIGSGFADDWKLEDSEGAVRPDHCDIIVVDGSFCLKDTSGETYINGSSMPIGKNGRAKLCHKDEINIGPYHIRVLLTQIGNEQDSEQSLDQLISTDQNDLLDNGEANVVTKSIEESESDPLLALDDLMGQPEDPERLINQRPELLDKRFSFNDVELQEQAPLVSTQQSDGESALTSSIGLKRILGFGKSLTHRVQSHFDMDSKSNNNTNNIETRVEQKMNKSEGYGMNNNVLDLLEEEVAKSMTPSSSHKNEGHGNNHLLTGPMLNGMGVDFLDSDNMEKMHVLSQELGESLRSCIEGLLELHKQIDNGHFGIMNRSLQPIEDNPLRLGLDYQETIKTMYESDKSLVHLSAPAAINESLKNIRDHNDAVQHATGEALQQILAAFSPQVLLRRFNSYKRSQENDHIDGDSWAWNMYCSYYEELTSSRQKGFEKLFWQIFEQSYDKKIREKQLEF